MNCIQIHVQMKNLCSFGAPLFLGGHGSKGHIFQRQSFSMVKNLSSNPLSYNLVFKLYMSHSFISSAGRAAMVGFFAAYIVEGLTGLDMVGQTGNFICKTVLFVTVTGIILFRRTEDFKNLRKLVDEATFYDKQWQASWKDQNAPNTGASENKVDKM